MACITKRRNRWVIDFYDNRGKRRWITTPKGTTKTKVREKLREIEEQLAKGSYLPEKKIPIFKKVTKDWLKQKKLNVRANTWKMYEMLSRIHLASLNDLKVNRISIAKVEGIIFEKKQAGMNLNTLRKVIITLNQIMQYAVRHRYIDYNPVRDAERPRDQGECEEESIRTLSIKEINRLLDAESDLKHKTLLTLAIMSGVRQGELLGLKWTDIDWFNKQINIKRTFNHGEWYKPKTKTSHRKIDIGPSTIQALKKWHSECPETKLDLVFPNDAGRAIDQSNLLRHHFFPALKKARIERLRFHDLRHTYASLMIEQGENIKYVQSQLGHSSPTVTLNVYAHLMKPVNQEAACRLENTIFDTSGSNMVAKVERELALER